MIARTTIVVTLCLAVLAGCNEQVSTPGPVKLTRDSIGTYCNMIVADHPGPKIQVHERDGSEPVWFSSVRDGLAYLSLPGEAQRVLAVYVHDMGLAQSWEKPQDDGIWIAAAEAVYVIGSARRGGMGAKEAVPFGDRSKAEAFAEKHGGTIVAYEDIPADYILGDEGEHMPVPGHDGNHEAHGS